MNWIARYLGVAVFAMMLSTQHAHAGIFDGVPDGTSNTLAHVEGSFTGLFPQGSGLHALSSSWTISVDLSPFISNNTPEEALEGVFTSVSFEAREPSPGGPIAIPYPNVPSASVVVDCRFMPSLCLLHSVTLRYSFGILSGLEFTGDGPVVLDGRAGTLGIQALFGSDQTLSSMAFSFTPDGDDVGILIPASTFSGSFREVPRVSEPALTGLLLFGILGSGWFGKRRKAHWA